jgi:hypothetical protein
MRTRGIDAGGAAIPVIRPWTDLRGCRIVRVRCPSPFLPWCSPCRSYVLNRLFRAARRGALLPAAVNGGRPLNSPSDLKPLCAPGRWSRATRLRRMLAAEVADGAQARREDAPGGPRRRGRLVSFSPGQARADGRAYVPPEIPPLRLRRQLAPGGAEPSRWLARSRYIPVSHSRGGLLGGRGAVGGRSVSSSEALRFGRRDPRLTHAERGAKG